MDKTYAESINYWQTSKKAPSAWIDEARGLIEGVGGRITQSMHGEDPIAGHEAYMLMFQIGDDYFKLIWPVLESKTGKHAEARVQAATMLYHDVKSKCVAAKVQGTRKAFFPYLLLDNGQAAGDMTTPELRLALESAFLLPVTVVRE